MHSSKRNVKTYFTNNEFLHFWFIGTFIFSFIWCISYCAYFLCFYKAQWTQWIQRIITYLPSDLYFAGLTRIWTCKPADPPSPLKNPHFKSCQSWGCHTQISSTGNLARNIQLYTQTQLFHGRPTFTDCATVHPSSATFIVATACTAPEIYCRITITNGNNQFAEV